MAVDHVLWTREKAEFIKTKFDEFDVDQTGFLDGKELPSLLKSLGLELSKPELDSAMLILDTNGSGKIEYSEFKDWLQGRELNFV